jgi:hypothetical protein
LAISSTLSNHKENTAMARNCYNQKPRYGFGKFLFDCFMTVFTAGFWLIWIYVREHRN